MQTNLFLFRSRRTLKLTQPRNQETFFGGGLLALGLFGIASAGQLDDGVAAARRGDYATAMRFWRPLTDQGNAAAQYNIGVLYELGQGVLQDYAQALVWFRKAAVQENAFAQAALGEMYADGWGVPKDYAQAAAWYRKAADQGHLAAQNNLGVIYRDGEGVPQDYAQALMWFRKAAAQGNAAAQYNLGRMYNIGEGVPQNYAQALVWLRKGAAQGNADAQFGLGMMYRGGEGVPQDYAHALMWFRKAAVQGNAFAQAALGDMSRAGQAISRAESPAAPAPSKDGSEVILQKQGGTFFIPVSINNAMVLNFIIDSGAADVSLPADVVTTLIKTGTLTREDFLGSQTYILADGSRVPSETFRIRTLKVGDREIADVTGSVSPLHGSLLLGQSFLTRFKSWSIDNERGVLVLK